MSLEHFHPVIQQWWQSRFGDAPPTPAQAEGWAAIRSGRHALIAAPTGSGKTLAAFLNAIDDLFREGLENPLPNETRVLYVSPLKALSTDIHRNLAEPRRQIRDIAEASGLPPVRITAAVRTGDTPQAERAAMLKTPPHILVTTPESLYLLLTAERGREMLRTVRTVIVDEIHAVLESRRGSHLALSLERLQHITPSLQRIGLSATQKPIETVARFLVGERTDECVIVDRGHIRQWDLALELPGSPLEAVMSMEVWQEVYEKLIALIESHRTTIVFVNTRRLAERIARNLTDRLGPDAVTAHHGSLAKEARFDAEDRLRKGKLRALIATSSLELGIDIGHVDLVCQIGSTHRIANLLQRVGRSGHSVGGTPKGRIFPLTRDDLIESVALLRSVQAGELDHIIVPHEPLDVLAQQIVAETAASDWNEDELYELVRRAYPYRGLERSTFDEIVRMLATGFTTQRGRRAALLHRDEVQNRVRGRKGARLAAITSGGAIPEVADYRVILEPDGTFIGTVNEDFAVESMSGDVFQLGNASWRVLRIQTGVMRVEDAHGQPPNIPFWFGEAPARSDEVSARVSELRTRVDELLRADEDAVACLMHEYAIPRAAAEQIVHYLSEGRRALGAIPSQRTIVLERFFDESGGMQIVLHAPFGSRVNKAWGLALRKRFCRTFNFELQAAATEEGIILSLGPQHSFPLDEVFRYLTPATVRETLVQAVLDAPLFQTRWRWNTTLALAVPRSRGGRKVPPQLQRMQAEDLLSAVFPEATACLEHIVGDREVPDHPLIRQTLSDCLDEAMDLPHLTSILADLWAGRIECIARDTPEPSPLCHEILTARPYAFLDDAPLEERRTQAVYARRATEPFRANDLGALDQAAIDRVRAEVWPEAHDADDLHDVLLTSSFMTESEGVHAGWQPLQDELIAARRAVRLEIDDAGTMIWCAAERVAEFAAGADALPDIVRGRLEILGPVTAADLAASLHIAESDVDIALHALEAQGVVLRGHFTPDRTEREWCDRRLLARIHRYTLNRLRAEIQPVSATDLMRFLFRWQRVDSESRAVGIEGVADVIAQLQGFEAAAAAWESAILPARCVDYDPQLLDMLCLSGRVVWGRTTPPQEKENGRGTRPLRSSPIALFPRTELSAWLRAPESEAQLGGYAQEVHEALTRRGALFFHEIVAECRLIPTQVEQALAELAAGGRVTADSFAGLRALLMPSSKRGRLGAVGGRRGVRYSVETAGRWSLLHATSAPADIDPDERLERHAHALLKRYGVVFRRLVQRDVAALPWRDLVRVYRRMEARGDVRGGRFVSGFAGEQFALPEAVTLLRKVRNESADALVTISAADPLNLTGYVTPGERLPAIATHRIVFRGGLPVATIERGNIRLLVAEDSLAETIRLSLRARPAPQLHLHR